MRDFAVLPVPRWAERFWAEVGLAVACGFLLALWGPFHTYQSEPLQRLGFWIGLCAVWCVLMMVVEALVDRSPLARHLSWSQRLAVKLMLATFPMLLAVAPAIQALFHVTPAWHKVLHLYPKTLLVGAGMTLVSIAMIGRRPRIHRFVTDAEVPVAEPRIAEPVVDALQERLPLHLRGPILCLQMEDHYVRIHTARGSAMVLMRMGDAVAALGERGLRVHRSWWVAHAAVKAGGRAGRTLRIELHNGLTVPVSKPYSQTVRETFGH
ncbi:LytTR family transcriptional regulator DNA-binding domain-containing protein [Sphingomonas sp. BT-65]|uniref:LytTR family DNA-binding domain-containing protein n=1 Tax=Sphingomonas sp. BT-65 TaxID=2989821 RepID=UPI0022367DED|nr:LytTR family DNA-binding domain-containing protein [Sphingomonas sp. BT-65]MCW4461198.1 LytTR family transcriptional regulator DNA-binding domain-containing protein [Sphingomonas sp. BT-65]